MLTFNNQNIFKETKSFISPKTKLLPFQIAISKDEGTSTIVDFKLINGATEIDLMADIALIEKYESSSYFYHIFKGVAPLTTVIREGLWQLYIRTSHDYGAINHYSNFFEIVCESQITGYLDIWNSKDFQNVIFQAGYVDKLYFSTILKNENPYKKEKITEQGDGTQIYESQIIANGYSFKIIGDNFLTAKLQEISFYDNAKIHTDYLDGVNIFQRIQSEQDFNENTFNYNNKIIFYVAEIDKELCLINSIIWSDRWILEGGIWYDMGIWDDTATWND